MDKLKKKNAENKLDRNLSGIKLISRYIHAMPFSLLRAVGSRFYLC